MKPTAHVNGPAGMRSQLTKFAPGYAASFRPSVYWKKTGSGDARGAALWDPVKTPVSNALKSCLEFMHDARERLAGDPLYRDDFSDMIEALDRYWIDKRSSLLEECDGVTGEDALWLALSHLFHVDKKESKALKNTTDKVTAVANSVCQPYTTTEEYTTAVLKSELKFRIATFHAGKEIFIDIQKPPPPPPPDVRKLQLKLPEPDVYKSPAEETAPRPQVKEPRLVTPLGVLVGTLSSGELLAYCSAYAVQFNGVDQELVSLATRLYFAVLLNRYVLQLGRLEAVMPDAVLQGVTDLHAYLLLSCQSSADHMSSLFRDYLTELYLPACCFSRHCTIAGKVASAGQKLTSKFMTTVKELMPCQYSLDGLIDFISNSSERPPREILAQNNTQLLDDFTLFYFAFMFEAQTNVPFTNYLIVTEHLYDSLKRLAVNVAMSIPHTLLRPVMIIYGQGVLVKDGESLFRCRSKREACVLWSYLVMTRHGGKTEEGKSISKGLLFINKQIKKERAAASASAASASASSSSVS